MAHSHLTHMLRRLILKNENSSVKDVPADSGTQVSRREFMRKSALTSAAGIAFASAGNVNAALLRKKPKVAVIGAGMAGLNATYQLRKAGVPVDLYEASGRVGGRIYSRVGVAGPDLVTELGAEFINTDHDDMLTLCDEFGLKLFNRIEASASLTMPRIAYIFDDRFYSESDLAGDLRDFAEQIMADNALIDADYDTYASQFDALSARRYFLNHADKITKPYIQHLLDNMVRTEYGVEPEHSSALQFLYLLTTVEGDKVELLGYSDEMLCVEGGNSLLPMAMGKLLKPVLQFHKVLKSVEKTGSDYELAFDDGTVAKADYVVLAVPQSALRKIEINVRLPNKLKRFIEEVEFGQNEKVIGGFESIPWQDDGKFGLEAWSDLGFAEAWYSSQRQSDIGRSSLTFFLGGKQSRAVNNDALLVGSTFVNRLQPFVPSIKQAANQQYFATHWGRAPRLDGAYSNFKPGQLTEFEDYFWVESDSAAERQEVAVGGLVFAGEQFSDAYYGFMNGGAQTGRLAAERILRKLVKG